MSSLTSVVRVGLSRPVSTQKWYTMGRSTHNRLELIIQIFFGFFAGLRAASSSAQKTAKSTHNILYMHDTIKIIVMYNFGRVYVCKMCVCAARGGRNVVLVEGVRTPFLTSGTR